MFPKWYALTFLVLLIHLNKVPANTMKWGKIPKADLEMRTYPLDSSANAIVLGDIGKLSVYRGDSDYEYSLFRHTRIKILNKKGFEWADITVPVFIKNGIEEVKTVQAQIISPSGKKYTLTKKEFFREKVNDSWSLIKFTFPNLEEGCVIEYQYRLTSKNIVQLNTWYFHNELPTRLSELKLNVEPSFSYVTLFQGGEEMEKTLLDDGTTQLKASGAEMWLGNGHYIMKNAPAFKEEAFITTIDDYRARIRFQLQEVQYPDGFKQSFLSTWEELARDLMSDQEFGGQFERKRNYKKIAEQFDAIHPDKMEASETVEAIYNFVAQNMEWNGKYGLYAKEDLNKIFERKEGRAVELNLMVLALLRHRNIEAYPLLSATRSYGKMLQDYPIIEQFNHVMVLANTERGDWIVDIPSQTRPVGLPEANSLNSYAWLVDAKEQEWISLNAPLGKDTFRSLIEISEDGQVNCQMNTRFSNYNAIVERANFFNDPEGDYWKERLARKLPEVEFDRFEVKYLKEPQKQFVNNLVFSVEEAAQQIGDFIYLSPILYSNFQENPFKQEIRYYPVDFPYPFEEKYTTTIVIPEGYKVEELPEAINYQLKNEAGFFNYKLENKGHMIQLVSQLQIAKLKISPENYSDLKKMMDLLLQKHAEQIVLKKLK
jgi:hypothetical protein